MDPAPPRPPRTASWLASLLQRIERATFPRTGALVGVLGFLARRGGPVATVAPGGCRLVLLQIDGLAGARLERALAAGEMPRLARRLASGRWRLERLRT